MVFDSADPEPIVLGIVDVDDSGNAVPRSGRSVSIARRHVTQDPLDRGQKAHGLVVAIDLIVQLLQPIGASGSEGFG